MQRDNQGCIIVQPWVCKFTENRAAPVSAEAPDLGLSVVKYLHLILTDTQTILKRYSALLLGDILLPLTFNRHRLSEVFKLPLDHDSIRASVIEAPYKPEFHGNTSSLTMKLASENNLIIFSAFFIFP